MLIKECNKSDALERYAVVAVGSGAITAARKIFENDLIKENFSLYECESIPLGCGGDVAVGRQKAEERLANDKILCRLICKKVFVVSTLGGGTGTGGAPVIAKYLFDRGMILTNIVTIPFKFEGPAKMKPGDGGGSEPGSECGDAGPCLPAAHPRSQDRGPLPGVVSVRRVPGRLR